MKKKKRFFNLLAMTNNRIKTKDEDKDKNNEEENAKNNGGEDNYNAEDKNLFYIKKVRFKNNKCLK